MITTLSMGAILTVLAVSLIGLYFTDYRAQRLQQQAIQAYWNARSGVELYCDQRTLPKSLAYELGKAGRCDVIVEKNQDLTFVGKSGEVTRRIVLPQGDPALRREEP